MRNAVEKIFGICLIGLAMAVCVLLLSMLFPIMLPVAIFIGFASVVVMFITFLLEVAFFLLFD